MITSSLDGVQNGLEIVQRNVMLAPGVKPDIVVVAEFGFAIVAVPEMIVHKPVPTKGTFPAKVAVVVPHTI